MSRKLCNIHQTTIPLVRLAQNAQLTVDLAWDLSVPQYPSLLVGRGNVGYKLTKVILHKSYTSPTDIMYNALAARICTVLMKLTSMSPIMHYFQHGKKIVIFIIFLRKSNRICSMHWNVRANEIGEEDPHEKYASTLQ